MIHVSIPTVTYERITLIHAVYIPINTRVCVCIIFFYMPDKNKSTKSYPFIYRYPSRCTTDDCGRSRVVTIIVFSRNRLFSLWSSRQHWVGRRRRNSNDDKRPELFTTYKIGIFIGVLRFISSSYETQ